MRLSDFQYDLPSELIAQYPAQKRDECRLLVVDRTGKTIEHGIFRDIERILRPEDLLVLNDTKVLTCRLRGFRKTGGKVEIFILRRIKDLTFEVMLRPGRVKIGEKICLGANGLTGTLTKQDEFTFEADSIDAVYAAGEIPLPPYIKRPVEASDAQYYQTVYAASPGSVASPTAGLHFTPELLRRLEKKGVDTAYLTLHVGTGTFKPVTCDDITEHVMDHEYFTIPLETLEAIERHKKENSRIIAVGTTSCRTLESFAAGRTQGQTDLFIYPGYEFKLVSGLLTNFHLPATTLYMLVCAFAGMELARKAYSQAIEKKYRFYSYGDAMLVI
ncbi:MAG: tRNA preQ1(34) S-adenosylmethionine ribosyltransferase-isomerase QueA [Candidatus Omnitrophica bacterium]|nr:tRNA preQ1(34) S-adenosylmethionine ribosyltransferase-isomerase QueA [Candidatus Omnitrophota bacterium]